MRFSFNRPSRVHAAISNVFCLHSKCRAFGCLNSETLVASVQCDVSTAFAVVNTIAMVNRKRENIYRHSIHLTNVSAFLQTDFFYCVIKFYQLVEHLKLATEKNKIKFFDTFLCGRRNIFLNYLFAFDQV